MRGPPARRRGAGAAPGTDKRGPSLGPPVAGAGGRARKGHIESFLEKADKALDSAVDQGVKKADDILDTAVSLGKITTAEAKRASESLRKRVAEGKAAGAATGEPRPQAPSGGGRGTGPAGGSRADALEALARLGELRKARVITEKEFKEKKAKLLEEV